MSDPTRPRADADLDTPEAVEVAARDAAVERPVAKDDETTVKATGAPAGAAAGAIAGATAGLATGVFGPIGAIVGAIAGGVGGATAGAAGGQVAANDLYTGAADAHYRALWEAMPDRPGDRSFESVRLAYQFGHVAAQLPEYVGCHFGEVEPELRRQWSDDFRARAGAWEGVCHHVEDAFSHARSEGLGERRDRRVIGSAGSAVDPVELERARAGLPTTDASAASVTQTGDGRDATLQ